MAVKITFSEDPAWVLANAHECLAAEPVLHNVILTLLHERVAHPEPGRYWVASEGETAIGVVFQSPPTFPATLTPMETVAVAGMVEAIVDAEVSLPGVIGDATTASRFAGQWTECSNAAASPHEGQRIYELEELHEGQGVSGRFRNATMNDRDLIVGWLREFQADTGERGSDADRLVDARLPEGQYWIWEDGEPVSMASGTPPIEGVSRIGSVYTPPERRSQGYAEGCVRELSRHLRTEGLRCILYTDLANPSSNSIYRRIGYRAIAEVLRYRFD